MRSPSGMPTYAASAENPRSFDEFVAVIRLIHG